MIFEGDFIQVLEPEQGILELVFNNSKRAVNVLSSAAIDELGQAVALIKAGDAAGLIVSSSKDSFIVGADITEFLDLFESIDEVKGYLGKTCDILNDLEDLAMPSVTLINGDALGGGFEVCLSTDFRVAGSRAKVGLPEVKLGLVPGFGGTVRLPRLIGAENALEWMVTGASQKAESALKAGALDAVVEADHLRAAGLDLIEQCRQGKIEYQRRRAGKKGPLRLNATESAMAFETAKGMVMAKAGPHYPAPLIGVRAVEKAAALGRDEALAVEAEAFAELAQTDAAAALIGLFLNGQVLKKLAKSATQKALPVQTAAVLGAGIMGGGIAFQSALKGKPVIMKDIAEQALQLGMNEATKQLNKRLEKGRLSATQMAQVIASIKPTLKMEDVADVDLVVEAVVENPEIKQAVLAETEAGVSDNTIITSNTSTISIDHLAQALTRPERFCGMHFFNPVPLMPLVEVIRGERTSDETVATVVAYAAAIGKTPVVVNDCPGFFVNRVLFPYFFGFNLLIRDGADFRQVDRVMEDFGWPMGPAYLQDVVGIDTCHHCVDVMSEGFPERMGTEGQSILDLMYEAERYGQKNGKGYYAYEADKRGKPKKVYGGDVEALIDRARDRAGDFSAEEIVNRMMVPMCLETVRCLEEGIVATPAEADMALIMGIGFPQFRGGALKYIDTLGADNFCKIADSLAALGPLYEPTAGLRAMAESGKKFFS